MTKQAIDLQVQLYLAKGGRVTQCPAARAFSTVQDAFARGMDSFHARAFIRAAKGA